MRFHLFTTFGHIISGLLLYPRAVKWCMHVNYSSITQAARQDFRGPYETTDATELIIRIKSLYSPHMVGLVSRRKILLLICKLSESITRYVGLEKQGGISPRGNEKGQAR